MNGTENEYMWKNTHAYGSLEYHYKKKKWNIHLWSEMYNEIVIQIPSVNMSVYKEFSYIVGCVYVT